jgi:hypothetical protein
VVEAASWGVPCVALRVLGIQDSVLDGRTGWLVDRSKDFGTALSGALTALADESRAEDIAAACREWAHTFTWDRSAELLAGLVLSEIHGRAVAVRERRSARSDMTVLAEVSHADRRTREASFRCTDEVAAVGDRIRVLLRGCDEVDAAAAVQRIGARATQVGVVDQWHLLAGPAAGRELTRPLAAVASA